MSLRGNVRFSARMISYRVAMEDPIHACESVCWLLRCLHGMESELEAAGRALEDLNKKIHHL